MPSVGNGVIRPMPSVGNGVFGTIHPGVGAMVLFVPTVGVANGVGLGV